MTTAILIDKHINISLGLGYSSDVQPIILMAVHGDEQTDRVLEKELRVLQLDPQGAEGDYVTY